MCDMQGAVVGENDRAVASPKNDTDILLRTMRSMEWFLEYLSLNLLG